MDYSLISYSCILVYLKKPGFEKTQGKNRFIWKNPGFIGFFQNFGFFANPGSSGRVRANMHLLSNSFASHSHSSWKLMRTRIYLCVCLSVCLSPPPSSPFWRDYVLPGWCRCLLGFPENPLYTYVQRFKRHASSFTLHASRREVQASRYKLHS